MSAHLRRYARLTGGEKGEIACAGDRISVQDVVIDPRTWRVWKNQRELKVPHREFALLCFLAQNLSGALMFSTLINEAFANEMLRVKNFVPAISTGEFEEATDFRRGRRHLSGDHPGYECPEGAEAALWHPLCAADCLGYWGV